METVPRLYRAVRSGSRYERSLRLLGNVKRFAPGTVSKTGVMVGLGETTEELLQVFRDIAAIAAWSPVFFQGLSIEVVFFRYPAG